MHRETAKDRGRSRSLVVLLLALALVAVFGILAQQALALPTFNTAEKGIGPCDKCHSMTAVHGISNHSSQACDVCHKVNTATPPLPSACASCHGASTILAAAPHTAQKCGTTDGCHGYVAPAQPTIAIDTVTPKSVKIKKTIALSGGVTPITTPDTTPIGWVVQLKKGSKWVQVKAGAAKLSFLGGAMRFSFTYKPTKVGSYRSSASFKPDASKITSKWVLFKAVK
jgi:hypothetical protein